MYCTLGILLVVPHRGYTIVRRISGMKVCLVQVAKWGNSLAIRLSASVVEALELREGG